MTELNSKHEPLIIERYYGDMKVIDITLKNDDQIITLSSLGASIIKYQTKDRKGQFENIVLTYQNKEDYLDNPKFLGAVVGPFAGRIDPPVIHLNDRIYFLDKNHNNTVNLHSGVDTLTTKNFKVSDYDASSVTFTYQALKNKTFPTYQIKVTYQLIKNQLILTFESESRGHSVINPTQHSYFNLSGNLNKSIVNHNLKIPAQFRYETNQNAIPKALIPIMDTAFDFQEKKLIKDALTDIDGIDHPYKLNQGDIVLEDAISGRILSISTDYDHLVVYTNNDVTDHIFEPNVKDMKHLGICLECQHVPNDLYLNAQPKSIVPPFTVKKNTITYTHSITQ